MEELEQAWERVAENGGCAGADGVTVERFSHEAGHWLSELLTELSEGHYRAYPLLRIEIEKRPGALKHRVLLVPSVRDRVAQTAVARRFSRVWEEGFLDSSFAYRRGRGVDTAVARISQWRDRGSKYGVDSDIEGFFDNVPHGQLLQMLGQEEEAQPFLEVVEGWVKAWEWDGKKAARVKRGIPQGSPLSPVLANLYLTPLDRALGERGMRVVRYADDLLVLCAELEEAQAAMDVLEGELGKLGLALNRKKTEIVEFARGFHFLGAFFFRERVFVPWGHQPHEGRLVFRARPMPARMKAEWRNAGRGAAAVGKPVRRSAAPAAEAAPAMAGEAEKKEAGAVAFLYVMEQGTIVRKSGERLLLEREGQVALETPAHKLESVLLFGNVQVTSAALGELLDDGVRLSLFTRQARYLGALVPAMGKNVDRRMSHYELARSEEKSLEMGRLTVRAKIENGRAVLRRYQERNGAPEGWGRVMEQEAAALEALEAAGTVAGVMGAEGAAARAYFDGVMKFNTSELPWVGRVKHPATDPLNALMSLAYTLVMHELMGLVEWGGLDSGIGFLHEVDYGRPSLALDLMEPFRHALCDRFVLGAVNRGSFHAGDFERHGDGPGVFLKQEGMRKFFEQYETWVTGRTSGETGGETGECFRDLLRREVEKLERVLDDGRAWAPYRFGEAGPGAGGKESVTIR